MALGECLHPLFLEEEVPSSARGTGATIEGRTTVSYDRLREAIKLCEACPLGTQGQGVPGMWVLNNDPTCSDEALEPPGEELEHHPECKLPYYGGGVKGCISRCQAKQERVMVLGEAPGGVEQARGKPFQGGSGQLLHSLFKEAGLNDYYVSNIAKHRPPVVKGKQQAPDKAAIDACAPFLRAEFDLVRPAKLILLGKTAAKLVCEGNFSMGKVVNQTFEYNERIVCDCPATGMYHPGCKGIPTLILYHPAHFLYNRTAPWIQTQVAAWKRAVRMFMGDRPPKYQIEKVGCETHG